MDIKFGEYVRTNDGVICRSVGISEDKKSLICETCEKCGNGFYHFDEYEQKNIITKHSPKLAEILEYGDYVNNCPLQKAGEMLGFYDGGIFYGLSRIKIESVVTHEKFDSAKYFFGGN